MISILKMSCEDVEEGWDPAMMQQIMEGMRAADAAAKTVYYTVLEHNILYGTIRYCTIRHL